MAVMMTSTTTSACSRRRVKRVRLALLAIEIARCFQSVDKPPELFCHGGKLMTDRDIQATDGEITRSSLSEVGSDPKQACRQVIPFCDRAVERMRCLPIKEADSICDFLALQVILHLLNMIKEFKAFFSQHPFSIVRVRFEDIGNLTNGCVRFFEPTYPRICSIYTQQVTPHGLPKNLLVASLSRNIRFVHSLDRPNCAPNGHQACDQRLKFIDEMSPWIAPALRTFGVSKQYRQYNCRSDTGDKSPDYLHVISFQFCTSPRLRRVLWHKDETVGSGRTDVSIQSLGAVA